MNAPKQQMDFLKRNFVQRNIIYHTPERSYTSAGTYKEDVFVQFLW
mgnify:CR=1 FL=1